MALYILRRLLFMIPTVFGISIVTFVIIQLPPGDFLTTLIAGLASQGEDVNREAIEALSERYGLGQPLYVQYWKWMSGVLFHGDFGQSFEYNRPVADLIWDRLGFSVALALGTLLLSWLIAFPIGFYSATHQYTVGDYIATFLGFLGLAIPEFMLALVLLFVSFKYFGQSVGGLFSPQYVDAPWSLAKVGDLFGHLWIPIVIVSVAGTAGLIRITRANLLDELNKPYVVTARAKGLSESRVFARHALRDAVAPTLALLGLALPALVGGAVVTESVFAWPGMGLVATQAVAARDYALVTGAVVVGSATVALGAALTDALHAWADPRAGGGEE